MSDLSDPAPREVSELSEAKSAQLPPKIVEMLRRNEQGLVAAIAQDATTSEVLMLGWMNDTSLALTLATGRAVYWSRSRQELWRKGDTSGHYQQVHRVEIDCDGDALLLQVSQTGAACHTGKKTCFFREL